MIEYDLNMTNRYLLNFDEFCKIIKIILEQIMKGLMINVKYCLFYTFFLYLRQLYFIILFIISLIYSKVSSITF